MNSPSGLIAFDATDTEHLSRGQAEATRQILRKVELLRRHVPGCQEIRLLAIAPQLGLRDSRRIVGEAVLTEEDVLAARKFPETAIANGVHPIDLHAPSPLLHGRELALIRCGDYYQVPFGCLIPGKLGNVLVAGRPVSATYLAQGSLRVMATCMATGQAAGAAAALCAKHDTTPRDLSVDELRAALSRHGALL